MIKPVLKKGNCFLYMLLFKYHNPTAKILVGWNKRSRVISFSASLNNRTVFYRRKDRTQSKYYFEGKVIVINHNPPKRFTMEELQEIDLKNIKRHGCSNNE